MPFVPPKSQANVTSVLSGVAPARNDIIVPLKLVSIFVCLNMTIVIWINAGKLWIVPKNPMVHIGLSPIVPNQEFYKWEVHERCGIYGVSVSLSQPRNVNLEQEAGSELARSQHLKGRNLLEILAANSSWRGLIWGFP